MESKNCISGVNDSNEEGKRVSGGEVERYCTECKEKILPWRLVNDENIPYEQRSHHFHQDIRELIECGKRCRLCRYLCSLFGHEALQNFIRNAPEGQVPMTSVWHSPRAGWNEQVGPDGLLQYVGMAIGIDDPIQRFVSHEKREFTICTSAARAFKRLIWSSPIRIDYDARCSTVREWIQECDTLHKSCRENLDPNSSLAARILSIHRLSRDEFTIKLISTEKVNLHKERYFVLSHVWGTIDITCKTRGSNIATYETEGVPFNKLPLTFQDAVKITAAVGIQYLWIDSLCIIQDDEDDWQREAAKMASIFRFASLTIAATSARNSTEGCNMSAEFAPAKQFFGGTDSPIGFAVRGPEYEDAVVTLQEQMRNSTLNTRAWVFQEQILSSRTLHATHSQFVWQCAAMIESEDGLQYEDHRRDRNVRWQKYDKYSDRLPPRVPQTSKASNHYQIAQDWWFWVAGYMKRTLKVGSDQYAAIAGVVRLYQEMTNNEPLVGLWKKDLVLHLLWHVHRDEYDHKVPLPLYRMRRPSWTWMSFPHDSVRIAGPGLEWHLLAGGPGRHDIGIVYQAEAMETDISWSKQPLTSEPSGTITIRGICSPLPRPNQQGYGSRKHQLFLDPDLTESVQIKEAFHTIALVAYIQTGALIISPPALLTFYLVIEPIGLLEHNRYIRIGLMRIFRELAAIDKAEYEPQGTWSDIVLV